MFELNLKLETIVIESKSIKLRKGITWSPCEPINDIHPDSAKRLGTTQDEYRRVMNTAENYKFLVDGRNF